MSASTSWYICVTSVGSRPTTGDNQRGMYWISFLSLKTAVSTSGFDLISNHVELFENQGQGRYAEERRQKCREKKQNKTGRNESTGQGERMKRRREELRRGGERSQDRELLFLQLMWHAWHWFSLKEHSQVRAVCVQRSQSCPVLAFTITWCRLPSHLNQTHTHTGHNKRQSLDTHSPTWLWPCVWKDNS